MTTKHPRAWVSWSSGKDSALALRAARAAGELDVVGLLTTVNSTAGRVAMHAVRRPLLEAQAASLGLPVHVVELPWPCPNTVYEQQMSASLKAAVADRVERMVFGDLFLADVRAYREEMLAGTGITPVFPLWQRRTGELALEMIAAGFRAVLTCVDPRHAPGELAGRWFDQRLLEELPSDVDPCGENGEFHTFVVDGPGFAYPLDVEVGEIVERDGFRIRRRRSEVDAGVAHPDRPCRDDTSAACA
ncbi:MAG: ATP-binding protein [Pseudonocardiaceae bacterium]